MHASGKRGATSRGRNNGVAAGSVWDTRIRMDEVEGGVKLYNGDSSNKGTRDEEEGIRVYRRLRIRNHQSENSIAVAAAAAAAATTTTERRKRRNWKPPGGPITNDQLRKSISDLLRVDAEEEEEEEDEGDSRSFDDKEIDVAIEKKKPMIAAVEKEKEKEKVKIHDDVEEDHKKNKETEITTAAASSRPTLSENYVADHDKKNKETDQITMAVASSKPTLTENYVAEHKSSGISGAQTRMLNIVDLVMWRDVSRSAFVFGFGSLLLVSSSYAIDLNFSLISVMSYLGLVYLALIFLYKSILRRGSREFDARAERCMIGEEEAIWVLRFLLPYINEVLLKIRALFSGDPVTTMKLALLLFVLARWGGSLSTGTLVKLVFFGVFTIPKLSSYYVQLAKYGKFWLERFQDGWESCTHKKALAAAVFTLVWNISSTIARIWAVFMLVVAVKLYQQCVQEEQWNNNNGTDQQEAVTMEVEDCREEKEDSKIASGSLQRRQNYWTRRSSTLERIQG